MIVFGVELNAHKRINMIAVNKLLNNIGVSNKEDHMVRIVIGGTINAYQSIRVRKHMESTFAEIIDNKRGNIISNKKGVQHMTLRQKTI